MRYTPESRYMYIYNTANGKPFTNIIKHFLNVEQKNINIIPFDKIKNNEIKNYKVIIIDYLIVLNKKIENNINLLYNLLKSIQKYKIKLCFHLHDLHGYTFLRHKIVKNIKQNKEKKNVEITKNNGLGKPVDGLNFGLLEFIKQIKYGNAKYIISYYSCPEMVNLKKYTNNLINKYFTVPFHICPFIFNDYRLGKKYDILLYGSYNKISYKFRNRLYLILQKLKKKYRIFITSNSKYEELPKLINQSWLTIATTSNFSYLVRKYFEISACNSVVLGNMNEQGFQIWEKNYIHVDNSMTDLEIIRTISTSLSNKENLKKISEKMYHKIHSKYTYENFKDELINIYKYIDNNEYC